MISLYWKVYVTLLKICLYGENDWDINFLNSTVVLYSMDAGREKQLCEMLQLSFEFCEAFDHWGIAYFLTPRACQPFARD